MLCPDRPSRRRGLAFAALVLVAIAGCDARVSSSTSGSAPPPAPPPPTPPTIEAAAAPDAIRFEDVARPWGIDFVHVSGMTPEKLNPSANGSGVAIFDYDGDGKMDLYLASTTTLPVGKEPRGRNRLYRNLGGGKFQDVTETAGVGFRGECHGVIAGDLDNDGDPDLILCNYGPNVLYLNNGDGTFRDATRDAGLGRPNAVDSKSPNWSSGGALIDYDNDGDLDVYIANYADWNYERDRDKYCGHPDKQVRFYCGPKDLEQTRHDLYRNDGPKDGVPRFSDVTEAAGLARKDGHGFAAVAADLNGDGKIDLNVANDQCPAFLFLNNGDGTFRDATESSGAAFDDKGQALSGMGVDAEDLDGDGLPELFRSHFSKEYNTIHQNLGDGQFADWTPGWGMNMDSMPYVGWGCVLTDFDNDGWPDAFVANGHTDDNYHLIGRADEPFAQPPLLHRNVASRKGRKFAMVNASAGPFFTSDHVARGVAQGDLDDDGRIDLVVSVMDRPAAVLRNTTDSGNRWIRLDLRGTKSNRDALGARVEVIADGRTIHRQKKGGVSLGSSHDPRLLIGIGKAEKVSQVTIRWPSGGPPTVLRDLATGQTHTVVEP